VAAVEAAQVEAMQVPWIAFFFFRFVFWQCSEGRGFDLVQITVARKVW
jgi:hypothetical protein